MRSSRKIALIVQRCHESVLGGSEALAWQYATLLESSANVEVLTTTAVDYTTWQNELPPGLSERDGIAIRRFPVAGNRTGYWHELDRRLIADWRRADAARLSGWRHALEEEYIRKQGPWSPGLLQYVTTAQQEFQRIILFTYLYPTTYFSARALQPERLVLVPTLHDEPAAHLNCYRHAYAAIPQIIWNTKAEQALAARLWHLGRGTVIGMAIELPRADPVSLGFPYVLYSGRIDSAKGCTELFEYFLKYKQNHPGELKLVLTGKLQCDLPPADDILYKGLVTHQQKFELMRGATAFIMPSRHESLSIVTLESMGQRVPVLANEGCAAVGDHIRDSGTGALYSDYAGFKAGLQQLVALTPDQRDDMSARAYAYVAANYGVESVRRRLANLLCLEERHDVPRSETDGFPLSSRCSTHTC